MRRTRAAGGRVVAYTESKEYGGAERALGGLLAGLQDTGWRPLLMHPDAPGLAPLLEPLGERGIPTRTIRPLPEGLRGASRVPDLARTLRRLRPDVFHAHQTWPLDCKWALTAACLARVPAVLATGQLFVDVPMGRSRRAQVALLSRRIDRVIAVSNDTRRGYIQTLGWPADRVSVVYNAVEPHLSAKAGAAAAARRELDDGSGRSIVLVPARLEEQKGHRDLLRAARSLPDAHIVCAGDGDLRGELVRATEELGVADRVDFLGFRRDVPALMAASDVVALPSIYEGLPLALLEAMAVGKPVVATDVGGTSELVLDGRTGQLVPPGDPASLAGAIRNLTQDPALARRFGDAGAERVRDRFSSEAMVAAVAHEYELALGTTPRG